MVNLIKQGKLQNHTSVRSKVIFIHRTQRMSTMPLEFHPFEINCGDIAGRLHATGWQKILTWQILIQVSRSNPHPGKPCGTVTPNKHKQTVDTSWEMWYNHCPDLTSWSGYSQKSYKKRTLIGFLRLVLFNLLLYNNTYKELNRRLNND